MPKTKQQKKEIVNTLNQALSNMKALVIAQYSNLSINDEHGLRSELIKEGASFRVIKKTLLKRVLADKGCAFDMDKLRGTIGVAISIEDEVVPARIMAAFGKGKENFSIAGGLMQREKEIEIMSSEAIIQLATLPSRDELLAKAVGSIAAPLSGFVNVLAGPMRGLVNSLDAVRAQKAN